ncbi:MAG: LptA/OstA family protein [Verrucomicrobiota bacterium]
MKTHSTILAFSALLCLAGVCLAQDATDGTTEEGRAILSDPRLQKVLRTAKDDPEKALTSIEDKADEAVREATRAFQENRSTITETVESLPNDEDALEQTANSALSTLTRMLPKPAPSSSETPATRPSTRALPLSPDPTNNPSDLMPEPPATETVGQTQSVSSIPNSQPLESKIPDSPLLNQSEAPAPQPLEKKYQKNPSGNFENSSSRNMEITSLESTMDNNTGVITFLGEVRIDHPDFDIQCDKLQIYMADGAEGSNGKFKRAIATGGMVEITRINADGETQIALARRADYDGNTEDIVLSGGPPYLQAGDRFVKTNSEDAQIIMTGDGKYKVTGSDAGVKSRNKIVIPIDENDGTGEIGIGSTLGGGIERMR